MLFHLLNENLSTLNVKNLGRLQIQLKHFEGKIPAAPEVFRMIAALNLNDLDDFMRRDIIDLARTTVSRVQSYGFAALRSQWKSGATENARPGQCLLCSEASEKRCGSRLIFSRLTRTIPSMTR